ncbi:homocysteine S-methyltransferase, putative [Ixodes scapularis]|uniref:Homocysteine S-methyltransferase, putative n=1 Tax=Ixodes scapularis TaxID=6945 RepID=B7P2U0_IXOSC|nr:homocysteine S-methyltransferase, putative [Ixodes scapularis]|eukprot:XP_002403007.1 homocysteine S-methyltransferase, putative [Ixodes scapularis]
MPGKGLLERLDSGVVLGDGGFVFALEKRGYVKAGPWTPEACVEHPEAVRQLHREFLRAGADVMQAFTFYASDDKLINRGNEAGRSFSGAEINTAACKLAREVALEQDALVAGGISQTPSYLSGCTKEEIQAEFKKQIDVFVANKMDFLICEYFEHVEEMEMAIEVCKKTGLPTVASLCIGPEGDMHGVSAGQCAVRMVKAGGCPRHTASIHRCRERIPLGVRFKKEQFFLQQKINHGLSRCHLLSAALEPRVCSRWDIQRYAREAYEMGVRYIGGCCGFEPYHVRAMAEELSPERGGALPKGSEKHDLWGEGLRMHTKPWVRARAYRNYWENLKPSTGRPFSSSFSQPDNWGVTAGANELKQQAEATTKEEISKLKEFKKE